MTYWLDRTLSISANKSTVIEQSSSKWLKEPIVAVDPVETVHPRSVMQWREGDTEFLPLLDLFGEKGDD